MLMQSLLPIMTKHLQQTNYYYDTKDELMHKDNVTGRIRQKGKQLNGTIKRHLDKTIALRDGHTNGELKDALKEYKEVEKDLFEYLSDASK